MSGQLVSFENSRGQRLVGVLHGEPGRAAVISCHGMFSSKDGTKHLLLTELLAARGVPVLRFDAAGRGESEGRLFDLTFSGNMEDLDRAITFLAARGVERVGLFGSSMGGAVALLAAARDERVVAVATLAAVGYPAQLAERHPDFVAAWLSQGWADTEAGPLGRAFYDDALAHDVVAAVQHLRIPILVVHGERDGVVPVGDALDIAAAARCVSLEVVDGADHRFSDPVHLRPTMRTIADFLATSLGDLPRGRQATI